MQIVFLKQFEKDIDKIITIPGLKQQLLDVITLVESVEKYIEIPNLKKLKGFKNAYRIRTGEYRIGVFITGQTIEFARIVHRKDIYKVFP